MGNGFEKHLLVLQIYLHLNIMLKQLPQIHPNSYWPELSGVGPIPNLAKLYKFKGLDFQWKIKSKIYLENQKCELLPFGFFPETTQVPQSQ